MQAPNPCKNCFILPVCLSKAIEDVVHGCKILNNYIYKNVFTFRYKEYKGKGEYLLAMELDHVLIVSEFEIFGETLKNKAERLTVDTNREPRYIKLSMTHKGLEIGAVILDCIEHDYIEERKIL